jgi:hypothetical protein
MQSDPEVHVPIWRVHHHLSYVLAGALEDHLRLDACDATREANQIADLVCARIRHFWGDDDAIEKLADEELKKK